MKKLLFIFFSLVILSCSKQDDCSMGELPGCIRQIIDVSSVQPFLTVKMQKVNGECHYWLNTDAMHYDGVEYIVDSECDTVCLYCGECAPPECTEDHPFDKWETIWTQ